jgi:hypothetical protein
MRTALPRRCLAAAACLACAIASAAELGTLFTTPEERDRLDRLRRGEPAVAAAPGSPDSARTPQVTGFVKRSDGRNTVWIDGVPVAVGRREAARVLEQGGEAPRKPAAGDVRIERNATRR